MPINSVAVFFNSTRITKLIIYSFINLSYVTTYRFLNSISIYKTALFHIEYEIKCKSGILFAETSLNIFY